MKRNRRSRPPLQARSAFAGFRLPPDVILLEVRWYLRYSRSYRDLEELLAERGIDVYRAVDQHGQVIDVCVSQHRHVPSARRSRNLVR